MRHPAFNLKSLILPKEHGSWSLAFEPMLLGLIVAPSLAGTYLFLAGAAGFLARRPLKLALTLPAGDPRRAAAQPIALGLITVALLAVHSAAVLTSWSALWPLLLAVPFGAAFLWFDRQNAMREAAAELVGSVAFALTPAAFASLAGWSTSTGLALAAFAVARSLPVILTIRTYLRLQKHQPVSPAWAIGTAGTAWLGLLGLAACEIAPPVAPWLGALLLARTVWLVTTLRPHWPAKRVGQLEACLGAVCLSLLALAYHAG
ncbi:MAG: YwiC-like family protein, partial [Opitutaceae bacterium]|nr:YwiC-like family protein [Opitutaceae bacterium]